jgi:hypothetical protein
MILVDIDVAYEAVIKALGPFAHTTKVARTNAPGRGKLLYKAVDSIPGSTSWKPQGERTPWSELLSNGRQGIVQGEFDGGRYELIDSELGVMPLTDEEIAFVWYFATEGRVGLPEQTPAPQSHQSNQLQVDTAKSAILAAWTTLEVFEHWNRAGEIISDRKGENRLLGNGGLFVSERGWFCFSDDFGGYDAISAWAYCSRKRNKVEGREFWDVLREMAAAKGLTLPDSGAVKEAATLEVITSDPFPDTDPEGLHPLDIQSKAKLRLGWVDEYADLMTRMTGAPREFNALAGLVLVATVIQRRARLRMSFGDIYPNIYGAVIAPSSVYHKSSALAKPRAMLQRAMLDNLLLSELMTSEGLLKQLQAQPAGLVLRDEIGTLFASHNTKYLASLKPDLTALFDCYPYSRRLSNDEIKVQAPYLNILGATTPSRFFEGVSYIDWQDGFLARWLFVTPEHEPDFDAMTGLFTAEHDSQLGALAIALMKIDRQQDTDFELVSPAFGLWDTWQRKAAKDAYYYGDDVTAAIVTRYAAYALKFAMILAAVNDSWGTITPEIMQTAIDLADSFKATVYKLLAAKANYGVSGAKLQKVFRIIKGKAGTEGITQREIGQLCHMRKAELTPCMEKLISIGAVMTIGNSKTERYIPAVENLPAKTW